MITRIEALGYRCLRYVSQPVQQFQMLVGPNASGKTTFLDVIGFLGDLLSNGFEQALESRTANFQDLMWMRREESGFELAVEAALPGTIREAIRDRHFDTIRYEIGIGPESNSGETIIRWETVLIKAKSKEQISQRTLFPCDSQPVADAINPAIE